MGLVVGDAYIATFDYSVLFNLTDSTIAINDTTTYYNSAGFVSFAITVTSPSGIVSTSTIAAHGGGNATAINIPTINSAAEWGVYTILCTITDTTASYSLTKTFNLCKPEQNADSTGSDGALDVGLTFKCFDNKVLYADNTTYLYKSTDATSVARSVTVIDPNLVKQSDAANVSSFYITPIVNGNYVVSVDNTALYTFTNSITVLIGYSLTNKTFVAACNINLCEFYCALKELRVAYSLAGGGATGQTLKTRLDKATELLIETQIGIACGQDVSDQITELEKVLQVKCDCNCGTTNTNLPVCCEQSITITESTGIDVQQSSAGATVGFVISLDADVVANATDGTSNNISVTPSTVGNEKVWTLAYQDYLVVVMYISFDSGYISNNEFSLYGKFTLVKIKGAVVKTIAAGDAATVTLEINGVNVTNGVLSFPATSAVNTIVSAVPTALNSYSTYGEVLLKAKAAKPSPGGAIQYTLIYRRNG